MRRNLLKCVLGMALCVGGNTAAANDTARPSGQTTAAQGSGQGEMSGQKTSAMEVPVKDLNRHPERFNGQQVTVSGKVDRIESPRAFILDGKGIVNDQILVVIQAPGDQGAPAAIHEDGKVQLTGRLETMGLARIEERYRPGLRADIRAELEGVPVLVVTPENIKSRG